MNSTRSQKNHTKRWCERETQGLIGGVLGGGVGGFLTVIALNYFSSVTPVPDMANAVAVANTYIVYTTFLITVVAVGLAFGGIIFTRQFSMDKQAHVAHAYDALVAEIEASNGKAVQIIEEVMKNPDVVQHFDERVTEKLREVLGARLTTTTQEEARARSEKDAITSIVNDLR